VRVEKFLQFQQLVHFFLLDVDLHQIRHHTTKKYMINAYRSND
jgi:hypothetical protein